MQIANIPLSDPTMALGSPGGSSPSGADGSDGFSTLLHQKVEPDQAQQTGDSTPPGTEEAPAGTLRPQRGEAPQEKDLPDLDLLALAAGLMMQPAQVVDLSVSQETAPQSAVQATAAQAGATPAMQEPTPQPDAQAAGTAVPANEAKTTDSPATSAATSPPMMEESTATKAATQIQQPDAATLQAAGSKDGLAPEAAKPQAEETAGANLQYAEHSTEHFALRELDYRAVKVGETYEADSTSTDFPQQLSKQVDKALAQGEQRITVTLTPEHLGTVNLEITRSEEGSLLIRLQASTQKAAALLNEHSANLGALLRSSTQAPVQIDVQQPSDADGRQQQESHGGQQESGQQHSGGGQQHQPHRQEQNDFLDRLRLGIVSMDTEAS